MSEFLLFMHELTLGPQGGVWGTIYGLVGIPVLCLIESPIFLYAALRGDLPTVIVSAEHLELKVMLYSMFWSGALWYCLSYLVEVKRPYPFVSYITRVVLNYSVAGMVLLVLISDIKASLKEQLVLFQDVTLPEPPHANVIFVWFLLAAFLSWGRAYMRYEGTLPRSSKR